MKNTPVTLAAPMRNVISTFDSFIDKPFVTGCVVTILQGTNHNIRTDQTYRYLDGFHLKKEQRFKIVFI